MRYVVVVGSSRRFGNTFKVSQRISQLLGCPLINLLDYDLNHFDYENKHSKDDFIGLVTCILSEYDTIIFLTPVYWYMMSGIMKTFFDRFTDLLLFDKELGRKFRGKHMAVVTNSTGDNLGDNFWIPFKKTAEYLGVKYVSNLHTVGNKINEQVLTRFVNDLKS